MNGRTLFLAAVSLVAVGATIAALRYRRQCLETCEVERKGFELTDHEFGELAAIAREYDLELEMRDSVDWRMHSTAYINGPTIGLYWFRHMDQRNAAFFHELGHHVHKDTLPPYRDWPFSCYGEADAWRVGMELAEKHGRPFTQSAKGYAREQLLSYFSMPGETETDKCPAEHIYTALAHAGLTDEMINNG